MTPGMIGPKKVANTSSVQKAESKDIWDEEEIVEHVMDEVDDGRETPTYVRQNSI